MKSRESFILVKPCGSKYLDLIDEELEKDSFEVSGRYYVDDWATLDRELHQYQLTHCKQIFLENHAMSIWISNYFFGNSALIFKLRNHRCQKFEDLVHRTYNFKLKIRDMVSETQDGTCAIVVDINRVDITDRINEDNGFLKLENDGKITEFDDLFPQKGRYRGFFLNYVHCPDDSVESFEKELTILEEKGVLVGHNKLSERQYSLCKSMKSLYRSIDIC